MKRLVLTLATVALLGSVIPAQATPITYTETGIGTGTLGLSAFTDALVTITLPGDTSTVTHPSFFQDFSSGPVTVNVSGLGTAIFNTTIVAFTDGYYAGLFESPSASWLLLTHNSAFGPYDLQSPIGPVSGTAGILASHLFATSLGNFELASISGNTSTFTATTSPVPEPASIMLLGTGIVTLVGRRFRQRRA